MTSSMQGTESSDLIKIFLQDRHTDGRDIIYIESILSYLIISLAFINIFDDLAKQRSPTGSIRELATAVTPSLGNPTTWYIFLKRQTIILKNCQIYTWKPVYEQVYVDSENIKFL